jgi:hypothetical protein
MTGICNTELQNERNFHTIDDFVDIASRNVNRITDAMPFLPHRTPLRLPSSSQRSPKYSAALAPVVVSLKSVSNSWMTPLAPSFATSRALSARTISSACSSLSVRLAAFVEAYHGFLLFAFNLCKPKVHLINIY